MHIGAATLPDMSPRPFRGARWSRKQKVDKVYTNRIVSDISIERRVVVSQGLPKQSPTAFIFGLTFQLTLRPHVVVHRSKFQFLASH